MQPTSSAEFDTIVDQAVRGDTVAFGKIYDACYDRIYRHIYYRTGSTEDAQDLTQEVFTRAWKALPRYRKTGTPLIGWLMRIAHNAVVDHYRSKKEYSYLDNEIVFEKVESSPENIVEAVYDQQKIRKAILTLPEAYQQVILMSFIEGFSYAEIAGTLDKKEGAVRVIVHRALKKLKALLEKEMD